MRAYLPPKQMPAHHLERSVGSDDRLQFEVWRGFSPDRHVAQSGEASVDLGGPVQVQVCAWFSGGSAHEVLFQWSPDEDGAPGLVLRRHGQDKLQLIVHDQTRQGYVWAPIEKRRWSHIAARWEPGHLALYVDGELLVEGGVEVEQLQQVPRGGRFRVGCGKAQGACRDHLRGAMCGLRVMRGPVDPEALRADAAAAARQFGDDRASVPPVPQGRGKLSFTRLYQAADEAVVDFEANVRATYEWWLREGDVAIDAGAHSGKHTLPMARCVGDRGTVYAYEPLPFAFEELQASLQEAGLGDRVRAHNLALSNESRERMEFFHVEGRPGQSALQKRRAYSQPEWRPVQTSVQVVTLDESIPANTPIRFIKTDVEGAELNVFRGGAGLIEASRPVIHFEYDAPSYEPYGSDPYQMYRFFAERRYRLFDILGRRIESLSEFVESDGAFGIYDYLAFPEEHTDLDELVLRLVRGWL